MIDKDLIQFIVDSAELKASDIVLEIGYGHGELTKELAKDCKILAVDMTHHDLKLKNVTQIDANILDMFDGLYRKYGFNKIVSNIPYNISEPLMKLLFKTDIELIVLTVGKNFADVLSKKDNRIGIIANNLYDVRILKSVPKKAFRPMPRVESAVVMLSRKDTCHVYTKIVTLDDKKLRNIIERVSKKTKREVKSLTADDLFDKKLYELSNDEFIRFDASLKDVL